MVIIGIGVGEKTKPIQSQSKPISRARIGAGRVGSVLIISGKLIKTAI